MTLEQNCESVKSSLWDYTAGALAADETESVALHLRDCRECNLHRSETRFLRTGLKNLEAKSVPPMLSTRLQVMASHDRSRKWRRRNLAARLSEFRSQAKLLFDNLLRPIAVPAAGGLLASFLCFGVIVDTLHVQREWQADIPVGLFTQVALDDISPFSVSSKDVLVQLTVDADGKVSDFELPMGNASPEEMQEIGNLVLYSTFTPAISFGQRVRGKILVITHHINIRG